MMRKIKMRESTRKRYQLITNSVMQKLGCMSVMMAYAEVAEETGLTEEAVRRIVWVMKKRQEK
jgi:hypothetical protein